MSGISDGAIWKLHIFQSFDLPEVNYISCPGILGMWLPILFGSFRASAWISPSPHCLKCQKQWSIHSFWRNASFSISFFFLRHFSIEKFARKNTQHYAMCNVPLYMYHIYEYICYVGICIFIWWTCIAVHFVQYV